jgi:hypothetical protein
MSKVDACIDTHTLTIARFIGLERPAGTLPMDFTAAEGMNLDTDMIGQHSSRRAFPWVGRAQLHD